MIANVIRSKYFFRHTVLFLAAQECLLSAQTNKPLAPPRGSPGISRRAQGPLRQAPAYDNNRRIDIELDSDLATNFVMAKIVTGKDIPEQIAIVVKQLSASVTETSAATTPQSTNSQLGANAALSLGQQRMKAWKAQLREEEADWDKAAWISYTNVVPVDLGPGNGRRMIWVAGRWDNGASESHIGHHVRVFDSAPAIIITNPTTQVISQPIIQLQGYSERPLQSIRYDIINSSRLDNQQGFVNEQDYDSVLHQFSTNHFTCYDIQLAPGTNTIVLRCQDVAGNTATTRLTYFLDLEHDKTPPVISLTHPINGHKISPGSKATFNARGRLDDPTAKLEASIWADGKTNSLDGLVERNGYFWVDDIPLGPGPNTLVITATDAAGNSSRTNVVVYRSDEVLIMDDVPEGKLHDLTVSVTGRVSPSNRPVWVNGIEARVKNDGTWVAQEVPVLSPSGTTAVFEVTALPPPGGPPSPARPQALLSVETAFSTKTITLNLEHPACGVFKLHLTGAADQNFVLQSSINLTDWVAVLTNRNSQPVFDFEDTNLAAHKCRFFRVVPIP